MTTAAWITGMFIVAYVGYVAGRIVAAIVYLPTIKELERRNRQDLDWGQNDRRLAEIQMYERKQRIGQ